jgi:HK97 family phage prohead protease
MLKINGNTASGYLALYGSPSKALTRADGQQFIEVIRPGAFSATLADGHAILALSSHEKDNVLGSTTAGTLRIKEDATGLYAEIDLPDTTAGRDLRALLERGEPFGGSFGANVDAWTWTAGPTPDVMLCELQQLTLNELTVTAFPAYEGTSVVLRSARHPEIPQKSTVNSAEVELYHLRQRLMNF